VRAFVAILFGASILLSSCAHPGPEPLRVNAPPPALGVSTTTSVQATPGPATAPYQTGLATWYGQAFAGKKTSNGERFDPEAMTAAHRKLPFGTWVEVKRLDTGTAVRVRINDRGPWGDPRRIIDLSYRAAERLGYTAMGAVRVELRVVQGPE
jgi:rare lipoprotein A